MIINFHTGKHTWTLLILLLAYITHFAYVWFLSIILFFKKFIYIFLYSTSNKFVKKTSWFDNDYYYVDDGDDDDDIDDGERSIK